MKIFYSVVGFIAFLLLLASGYTVDTGEVAVVKTFGEIRGDVKTQGLHFKRPIIDMVIKMDVRDRKKEGKNTSASKDLQIVTSTVAVNYSIDSGSVVDIYSTVGREDSIERVLINPAIEESVKSATAKFNAEELVTKRDEARDAIAENLEDKLESRGININEVNIINFAFSKQFDDAIERKVTAEQDALKAKADLEKVKYVAQQDIERAKADAEKIRIQSQAVKAQGGAEYIELQRIEAMKQWVQAWQKGGAKVPQTVLGSESPYILNFR